MSNEAYWKENYNAVVAERDKLAAELEQYRQADRQPSVKSNTTVYSTENGEISEVFIVEVIESYTRAEGIEYSGFYADTHDNCAFKPSDFGKIVFLVRADAEQALKGLEQ